MKNSIEACLFSLGICSADSIYEYYPRVRDREDVKVMRCRRSGVIFLSSSDHMSESHYADQKDLSYWSAGDRKQALRECYEDDRRRASAFGVVIRNRRWLDVGAGLGGVLELLADQAAEACAVEPQARARQELIECGYRTFATLDQVEDNHFEVVTFFHVFEHLVDPLGALKKTAEKMVPGSHLIVEVPHANDFLLSFLDLEEFKKFTLWSEHLILHTRLSLESFLRASGFVDIQTTGYQRYPLANHLYWLAKGKPGGHKEWMSLRGEDLDSAYSSKLSQLDQTDTLIAVARKPD